MRLQVIQNLTDYFELIVEDRKKIYPHDDSRVMFVKQAIEHLNRAKQEKNSNIRDSLLTLALIKANEVGVFQEIYDQKKNKRRCASKISR
jgi:hypothetical protein